MLNVKRALATGAALALPLTALGAAPAFAGGGYDDHHYDAKPSVEVYDAKGKKVKVVYECDTNKHGKHDEDKYGSLKVTFGHDTHKMDVKCDGEEHEVYYKVYGHGEFKAVIKDPDGDKDKDKEYVNDKHHGHH
jgi:hypothetical protein